MDSIYDKIVKKTARIAVIGIGYVGLPSAVNFADAGFTVIGVSRTKSKIDAINRGCSYLPDLNVDEQVKELVASGKLEATTNTVNAVRKSDIVIITVPTPLTPDKEPDLSHIISAGEQIAQGMEDGRKLIILESTVYPGVTEEVLLPILKKSGRTPIEDFGLAYCPERFNLGDSEHNVGDVVRVISGIDDEWAKIAMKLYKSGSTHNMFKCKNIKTAEATKLVENIQRDVNIGLMNEFSRIFERMGIDIVDVIAAAATKWNFNLYFPGAGVGGDCLPVNPYYLMHKAEELGYTPKIIPAARSVNESMPYHVVKMLKDALNEKKRSVNESKIVILGFSYKENVGDIRGSPSIIVANELTNMGAKVFIVDKHVSPEDIEKVGFGETDPYDALKGADALILMTAHKEFYPLSLNVLKDTMRTPIIIDGRRCFLPGSAARFGFVYKGIGYVP
jgi:nucleotide sugar dehydrogenase